MRNRSGSLVAGAGVVCLLTSVLLAGERKAHACGGCFAPPENPTVVTDHRMVLTISPNQTTLYDQIRYQGEPASFAWVLPIAGVATIGLSSNILFGAIDEQTQTQIIPPPNPAAGSSSGSGGPTGAMGSNDRGGVEVLKAEQVGPYETVQLRSTDPQALTNWLTQNKFAITPEVSGIISGYVQSNFDFLAMKLVPGASVKEMRPIRVTTAGASPQLPLKMVAAGAGAWLGITLWVVAEGRYEPQNFPFFRIDDGSLVWDFSVGQSNYKALRAAFSNAFGGRAWEMESSIEVNKDLIATRVRQLSTQSSTPGNESSDGYIAIPGTGGVFGSAKTADQVREEDLAALFSGIPQTNARITRIRSDLAHDALIADLQLQASSDQDILPNRRVVTRLGKADCANCPSLPVPTQPPPIQPDPTGSGKGSAATTSDDGTFTCGATKLRSPSSTLTGIVAWVVVGFIGALALRRRRRK